MKIVIVNYQYFLSGGPERYMFNVSKLAENYGHTVIPFSVKWDSNKPTAYDKYFLSPPAGANKKNYSNMKKDLVSIFRFGIRSIYNFHAKKKIKKLLKDERPDLVYIIQQVNYISPSILSTIKKFKIPIIHRISDFNLICAKYTLLRNDNICELCIRGKNRYAIKYRCVKGSFFASFLRYISLTLHRKLSFYRSVDAFVFPSNNTRLKHIESNLIPKEKTYTLPTFVPELPLIKDSSSEKYALVLGRISPEKGHVYAIKAFSLLTNLNLKLYLTGNYEELDDASIEFICQNNLLDRIVFTGFLTNNAIYSIIANSLIVLMPAIGYENLPNALLESYFYSKPVIASNIGSFKDAIKHGSTGFLFEPKDYHQLADYIKKLYFNDTLREQMGKNANDYVKLNHNQELHWNNLMDIFKKITS